MEDGTPMNPALEGTQEIMFEQWSSFLSKFSRENRGAHARLEMLHGENGHHVEVYKPFNGVSADVRDGSGSVWITFWSNTAAHSARAIHGVTAIRTLSPDGHRGAVLEVQSSDGSRVILELSHPEAYALAPAS
jgi:hypothetical protein